jgi:cytochrome c-type biogenesis protein CcmF
MIVDLGHFATILALLVALLGMAAAGIAIATRQPAWVRAARHAVLLNAGLLTIALAALQYAFLTHDYSVAYVASHSDNALPLFYLWTALWGGHEGSLLLWVWLLGLYAGLAAWWHWSTHPVSMPYLLLVLSGVLFGFLCLVVFLSTPFERLPFTPADGQGLNPLLQDPGMVFHPPFLYMGYVGFAIPFAFAMAALLSGRTDAEWVRATRRWTVFAWLMLTWGIVMGGYWAYYELGWGGYWAWDPVENASLMPWLVGTAFLHSVMVQETRNMFRVWNTFLIILTFVLTLLGAFLVRSGVVSSVHAFATDPGRGTYILLFMAVVAFASFGTLIARAHTLKSEVRVDTIASRESAFLFNNLFFLVATATVFLGTIYPLALEAFTGAKVTVGPPYYNAVFMPIMLGLILLMGIGPLIPWRRASRERLQREFRIPAAVAAVGAVASFALGVREPYPLLGLTVSYFVLAAILLDFHTAAQGLRRREPGAYPAAVARAAARNKRRFGGQVVHLGVVMMIFGIIGSSVLNTELDLVVRPGESFALGRYTVQYQGPVEFQGSNYEAIGGRFLVRRGDETIAELEPHRRHYVNSNMPTTEAAIHGTFWRDVYLVAGNAHRGAQPVKAYLNPLVSWVWLGTIVMGIGTAFALLQGRRVRRTVAAAQAEAVA